MSDQEACCNIHSESGFRSALCNASSVNTTKAVSSPIVRRRAGRSDTASLGMPASLRSEEAI